ncbi:Succinoglycan biosynthesis protein [Bacillus thuringiensis serovar israelensis ATCC 35646]|nr:Succinoglycan biosynthesis protein [Bacillus thuringiensis serovar israelensis ATCC 35646]
MDDPNSYNYIFGQVKKDQFFIDLRKANGVTKLGYTTHPFSLDNYR